VSTHTTTLGRTGLRTSRIGLGAWGLDNPTGSHPAVHVLGEQAVSELLHEAYDMIISTKFGHGKGFSGAQVRDSVERSLAAFGIDSIPLFMLHDPRDEADLKVIRAAEGALPELRRLQDEGLIGSIGIATGTLPPLLAAVESDEFDVIQFPRLFTLLNDAAKASGLLERAKEKDIGTILTSPFTGDILATGVRGVQAPRYSFWDAQPEVVEAVERMQDAADAAGIALPEAAMAYALAEPLIDVVVIGVTDVAQLRQDVAVQDAAPDPAVLSRIAEAGRVDHALLGGPDFVWPFPLERMPAELKAKLGL
jgi:D-threo-aldose 1-dehydrogenase